MVHPLPQITPTIRVALAALALVAILLVPATAAAKGKKHAKQYLPPKHKVFTGISDTGQSSDYKVYRKVTAAHPAVMQSFESWGYFPGEAVRRWDDTNTRGMISLSTAPCWGCDGVISVGSIAEGKGDKYILALARGLVKRKKPTYIRLFPEMNGSWNDYSAFHGGGTPRDDEHSTRNFRKAWQRFALIIRGGKRKAIERKLRKLDMPKIKAKTKRKLPQPKVALAWVPQSTGSPNVPGNAPQDYFPGWNFIDWVGADIYGKYPNFAGLNSLYRKYSKRPFLIGEWSPYDSDNPAFVKSLFNWIEKHGRARMAVYYQDFGEGADNLFEITDYPQSLLTLRHILNDRRYAPFAPEVEPSGGGKHRNHR